jgi:hypothetical protein
MPETTELNGLVVKDYRLSEVQEEKPQQESTSNLVLVAMQKGYDPEFIKQMMDLRDREEKYQAKKAYARDMALFKKNPPEILKTAHVSYYDSNNNLVEWDHAELGIISEEIIKGLSEYGFYHRWTREKKDGLIYVTCILTHSEGHSEEVTMEGPPDTSGKKDTLKAESSTNTTLQRLTLLAITGLSAKGIDRETPPDNPDLVVSEQQAIELDKMLTESGKDAAKFLAYFDAATINDIKANKYAEAVKFLKAAIKNKEKK